MRLHTMPQKCHSIDQRQTGDCGHLMEPMEVTGFRPHHQCITRQLIRSTAYCALPLLSHFPNFILHIESQWPSIVDDPGRQGYRIGLTAGYPVEFYLTYRSELMLLMGIQYSTKGIALNSMKSYNVQYKPYYTATACYLMFGLRFKVRRKSRSGKKGVANCKRETRNIHVRSWSRLTNKDAKSPVLCAGNRGRENLGRADK